MIDSTSFPANIVEGLDFSTDTIIPCLRKVKIHDRCYAIYSTLHKLPLAVHELLDLQSQYDTHTPKARKFRGHRPPQQRDNKFYIGDEVYDSTKCKETDPQVRKEKVLEKGHMAAAANYPRNQHYRNSTYTYVNCIPQNKIVNKTIWQVLESLARSILESNRCESLEIISGPVFHPCEQVSADYDNSYQSTQTILLENGVVVPPKLYKIVKANKDQQTFISAFVIGNQPEGDKQPLAFYLKSVEQLELMTGLRFNFGGYKQLNELHASIQQTFQTNIQVLQIELHSQIFRMQKSIRLMNGQRKSALAVGIKLQDDTLPLEKRRQVLRKDLKNIIGTKEANNQQFNLAQLLKILHLYKDAMELLISEVSCFERMSSYVKSFVEAVIDVEKMSKKQIKSVTKIRSLVFQKQFAFEYPCMEGLKKMISGIDDLYNQLMSKKRRRKLGRSSLRGRKRTNQKQEKSPQDIQQQQQYAQILRDRLMQQRRRYDKFYGMVFTSTGNFNHFTKQVLADLVRANGGEYKKGMSKEITHLVVGDYCVDHLGRRIAQDPMDTRKVEAALKNSVVILRSSNFEEFVKEQTMKSVAEWIVYLESLNNAD